MKTMAMQGSRQWQSRWQSDPDEVTFWWRQWQSRDEDNDNDTIILKKNIDLLTITRQEVSSRGIHALCTRYIKPKEKPHRKNVTPSNMVWIQSNWIPSRMVGLHHRLFLIREWRFQFPAPKWGHYWHISEFSLLRLSNVFMAYQWTVIIEFV